LIDLKLIEECRGGNLSNFRKLVELTSPYAFSLAFRMLSDEDLARDVVQETMVTIWQKLKNIKSAEVYKTWIYKVVINKCYDQLRHNKRNREHVADEKTWQILSDSISQNPSSQLENDEMAKIIGMLTGKLSPKQRTIFILSEIEEMTSDEVSEVTGISKTVIKANLYHARKSISGMIEKYL
jgi:RNA polymerase sigma-70 factor (ECF subfamily)